MFRSCYGRLRWWPCWWPREELQTACRHSTRAAAAIRLMLKRSPLLSSTRAGRHCLLLPVKEPRVVIVLELCLPRSPCRIHPAPPNDVMPKRSVPTLVLHQVEIGPSGPLLPVLAKEARAVIVWVLCASSNTVPVPPARLCLQCRSRLPLRSATFRLPWEYSCCCLCLQEARVVIAWVLCATSNTVPVPPASPCRVVPKRLLLRPPPGRHWRIARRCP